MICTPAIRHTGIATSAMLFVMALPCSAQTSDAEAEATRYRLRPLLPQAECPYGPQDEDEVVVCRRRDRSDAYRVPQPRFDDPEYQGEQSWGARVGEYLQSSRWGSQTVGPGGYLQYTQQRNAEWREERRQIRARRQFIERLLDEQ